MGRVWVVLAGLLLAVGCSSAGGSDAGVDRSSTSASVGTTTSSRGSVSSTTGALTSTSTTTAPAAGGRLDVEGITVRRAVATTRRAVDGSMRTADGRVRTYHLYVPSGVRHGDATAVPLLVALHGGVGSGTQFERTSGFDGLAEANRFVVVYPDGVGTGADGTRLRTWNGGGCCGFAARTQVDDVGFLRALIAKVEREQPIDPEAVVVAGHSNGGILAYRLACELSDEVAAIGVQSTALEVDACHPSRPVSVLHLHGTADQNIPIAGGTGAKSLVDVDFRPPEDGAKALAAADRCAAPATVRSTANPDLTVTAWSSCADGTQVGFVRIAGATHAWMGHPTVVAGLTGAPYQGIDSSLVLWNFLAHHLRH